MQMRDFSSTTGGFYNWNREKNKSAEADVIQQCSRWEIQHYVYGFVATTRGVVESRMNELSRKKKDEIKTRRMFNYYCRNRFFV